MNIPAAVVIAVFFFLGGYLGSKLGIGLNEVVLKKGLFPVLAGIAIKMFFS